MLTNKKTRTSGVIDLNLADMGMRYPQRYIGLWIVDCGLWLEFVYNPQSKIYCYSPTARAESVDISKIAALPFSSFAEEEEEDPFMWH